MHKIALDYTSIQQQLDKRKTYKLADIPKDKIKKVAYDTVRFVDDTDGLDKFWRIEKDDQGDCIVALYEEDNTKIAKEASIKTPWKVILDQSNCYANVFYDTTPITKLALTTLHIAPSDAYLVPSILPSKLASDESFRNSFLKSLSEIERQTYFNLVK